MTAQIHKAINGELDKWIRGILATVLLAYLAWLGISMIAIQANRFTAHDGLEIQRQLTEITKILETKVDRSDAPPADYRRYVDSQLQDLHEELLSLQRSMERMEAKIDRLN